MPSLASLPCLLVTCTLPRPPWGEGTPVPIWRTHSTDHLGQEQSEAPRKLMERKSEVLRDTVGPYTLPAPHFLDSGAQGLPSP